MFFLNHDFYWAHPVNRLTVLEDLGHSVLNHMPAGAAKNSRILHTRNRSGSYR